jgi:hypothetical protein
MKEKLLATALSATMLFAASLRTAKAETSVLKHTFSSNGHDLSVAARTGEASPLAASNTLCDS